MRRLMRNQAIPLRRPRRVLPLAKKHITPLREGLGAELGVHVVGGAVGVDLDAGEVVCEGMGELLLDGTDE